MTPVFVSLGKMSTPTSWPAVAASCVSPLRESELRRDAARRYSHGRKRIERLIIRTTGRARWRERYGAGSSPYHADGTEEVAPVKTLDEYLAMAACAWPAQSAGKASTTAASAASAPSSSAEVARVRGTIRHWSVASD